MKRIIVPVMSLLLVFNIMILTDDVLAQESAFEEESAFGSEESSFEADSGFGDEGGFGTSFEEDVAVLSWEGTLQLDNRAIFDNVAGDSEVSSTPELDLDLIYQNNNSEVKATLDFKEDDVAIKEAFMRLYYDNFDLVVGKKKLVWGKGDKLHVVDNLNGEDLTDFINPDYLDRQIAEEMIKFNYYLGTGMLEAVYTPEFTPDELAMEGNWVTSEMQLLSTAISQLDVKTAIAIKESLNYHSNEFEDGQLGLRYTDSRAGYDYGFSFYQGHLKTPSMDMEQAGIIQGELAKDSPDSGNIETALNNLDLHYDEVSVFGAEFSSVIAGINSRAELAYYLTEDTAGDEPTIHNNKLAWIIGGDRDLGVHNINLNLQIQSELILDDDKVEDNNAIDVDYNEDDDYLTNMLVAKVSDDFKNETILPEVSLVYNIESNDYILDNEIEFILKDDTSLKFNYKLFEGDSDTTFGQFDDNDYLSAEFEYSF